MNTEPKRWPKIKLVDHRGRTLTVFERVPVFDRSESAEGLLVHEIFDLGALKPPTEFTSEQVVALIGDEFSEWFRDFYNAHGRVPGSVAEHALADTRALFEVLEPMLSKSGLTLLDREELLQLLRSASVGRGWAFNSCAAAAAELESAKHAAQPEVELKLSGQFDFVGTPRGDSTWQQVGRPVSRKAAAYAELELDRTGRNSVLMPLGLTVDFDGKALPAWEDVQTVLDKLADTGATGDTLTLTVDQLRRLVAQRC